MRSWTIPRRLTALDAESFRDVRLDGLRRHPEAFGASWEDEARQPLAASAERLERNVILGASFADDPRLVGVIGLFVPDGAKVRHKGVVWGMFVRPQVRGTGLGQALLARLLEHAAEIVEEVRLTVVASNVTASRLYIRAGFEEYGLERRALKVVDVYHDELLMTLKLRGSVRSSGL